MFQKKTSQLKNTGNVVDKPYFRREPSSPPMFGYESLNTSTPNIGSNQPTCSNAYYPNAQSTPVIQRPFTAPKFPSILPNTSQPSPFNQPTFQNLSNVDPYMQNVIWTPLQLPPTMFGQNKKQTLDRTTQTCDRERKWIVHTCDIPLSKRFGNYRQENCKIVCHTQRHDTIATTPTFGPISHSTDLANTPMIGPTAQHTSANKNLEQYGPIPKRIRSQSESENFQNVDRHNFDISTLSQSTKVENRKKTLFTSKTTDDLSSSENWTMFNEPNFRNTLSMAKPTVSRGDNIENTEITDTKNVEELNELPSTDLRLFLNLKRRKSIDLGGSSYKLDGELRCFIHVYCTVGSKHT